MPPLEELQTLQKTAKIGDFELVEQEARRIQQLAPEYGYFAQQVLELTEEFDEDGILKLLVRSR